MWKVAREDYKEILEFIYTVTYKDYKKDVIDKLVEKRLDEIYKYNTFCVVSHTIKK